MENKNVLSNLYQSNADSEIVEICSRMDFHYGTVKITYRYINQNVANYHYYCAYKNKKSIQLYLKKKSVQVIDTVSNRKYTYDF